MDIFYRFLENLFEWFLKRPRYTLFFTLIVTIILTIFFINIKTEFRLYDLNDPHFPSSIAFQEMKKNFDDSQSAFIVFSTKNQDSLFSYGELCDLKKWVHDQGNYQSTISSLNSPFEIRRPKSEGIKLWYRPVIDINCEKLNDSKLWKANAGFKLNKLYDGPFSKIVTNNKGNDLAVEFSFKDSVDDEEKSFDPVVVKKLIESAQQFVKTHSNLNVYVTGMAATRWYFKEAVKRDIYFQPLVILLIIIFFRVFFGSWRSGVMLSMTLLITTLWLYGTMSLFKVPLDLLNNNLFLMTSMAGVEDFLFVTYLRFNNLDWKKSFKSVLVAGFFTTVTTMIGFGSLCSSEISIISRFGFWAGYGALIGWMCVFFILPSICSYFSYFQNWTFKDKAWRPNILTVLSKITPNKKWGMGIAIGGLLFGLSGLLRLNYNDNPSEVFSSSHPNTNAMNYLKKTRDWETTLQVIFPDTTLERNLDKIDEAIKKMRMDLNVSKIDDPNSLIRFMTSGFTPSMSDLIIRELSWSRIFKKYFNNVDEARITIFLKSQKGQDVMKSLEHFRTVCRQYNCNVTGQSAIYHEYNQKIIPTLMHGLFISVALITMVLFILVKKSSKQYFIPVFVSSLWGPFMMIGLLSLFQISIDLPGSMFISILIGITGDNAIQYIFASKEKNLLDGISQRAEASTLLTMLLGFTSLVFLFQTTLPMRYLGPLFLGGFMITWIGDLFLLRAFLAKN